MNVDDQIEIFADRCDIVDHTGWITKMRWLPGEVSIVYMYKMNKWLNVSIAQCVIFLPFAIGIVNVQPNGI